MADAQDSALWILAFNGRYHDHVLERLQLPPERLLVEMTERHAQIERELSSELEMAVRGRVAVEIEFRRGSFEWFGELNAALGVVANVGGTIALLQLVGTVISRVLRRHMPSRLPEPQTRVVIVYAPQQQPLLPSTAPKSASEPSTVALSPPAQTVQVVPTPWPAGSRTTEILQQVLLAGVIALVWVLTLLVLALAAQVVARGAGV